MTNVTDFLNYINSLAERLGETIPDDIQEFCDSLKTQNAEKPLITESGLPILEYLQKCDIKSLKAKEIAEGMGVSSKQITGAIRKLVSDGYVDKYGQNPVIYSLTDKGKNFDIEKLKESTI